MKYAVIKNGGHQYKVSEGQVIEVEKLESDGKSVVFTEVLLLVDGDKVELGMPTIAGMSVYADVISEVKGEKIEVFKYKSKSRYRKHTGHRQKYTQVKITGIGSKPAKSAEPKVEKKEAAAKPKAEKKPAVKKVAAKKTVAKKAAK
jgi:large subunit ribosomal protein L21